MKKLLSVILCAILLSACTVIAPKSEAIKQQIPDEAYLTGLTPEELGLAFIAPSDMPLSLSPTDAKLKADGKPLAKEQSFLFASVSKTIIYPIRIMSYVGCMQAVFVRMKQMSADKSKLDGAYVLNFQLYSSDEFKDGMYAKIYAMDIPFVELEKRVIYQGDNFVAVDLTDYMLGSALSVPLTLEEHISARWPDGHPDAEYAYALREYVIDNLNILLKTSASK